MLGFPKIGGTILGVPIIRTIIYWGPYCGLCRETTICSYGEGHETEIVPKGLHLGHAWLNLTIFISCLIHLGPSKNLNNLQLLMGGCQNDGPFLGILYTRCRIIIGTQKGTIILTTTLMNLQGLSGRGQDESKRAA